MSGYDAGMGDDAENDPPQTSALDDETPAGRLERVVDLASPHRDDQTGEEVPPVISQDDALKLMDAPAEEDAPPTERNRGNRAQRRAMAAIEARRERAQTALAQNGERVVLGAEQAEKLARQRHMLMAILRSHGRMRIARSDLEAIAKAGGARIDVKVDDRSGDLVLSYLGDGHT